MTFSEFEQNVIQWASDRGILEYGTAQTQMLKAMEELGELAGAVAKGKPIEDHMGDTLVTLILVAYLSNSTCQAGWDEAWEEIKDRKGYLNSDGIFVKEE